MNLSGNPYFNVGTRSPRPPLLSRSRWMFIAAAAALLFLQSPAVAQDWYEAYQKGVDAFKSGQWQEAVRSLSEAIGDASDSQARKRGPGLQFIDYFPYVYRGVAYYKQGDRANALVDLEKAEEEKEVPKAKLDTDAARLLKDYLALLKQPAAPQTDARYAEGMRLFNKKDYKGAVEQFKLVPENSSRHAEAIQKLGLAEAELKKAETASAARDTKDRADKAFASGVQYFNQKDLDNAEQQFKAVLDIDGSRSDARRYLDRITTQRQKQAAPPATAQKEPPPKEPVREPQKTAANSPADTTRQILFRDAVALYAGGKIGQAKAKFLELQRLDSSYPELSNYLKSIGDTEAKIRQGISAFFAGEYKQAIDQLQETSRGGNDNPNIYAFLACSYAAQYLLTGAEDRSLRQSAVDAFGRTKKVDAAYTLNDKFISPKIISLLRGE